MTWPRGLTEGILHDDELGEAVSLSASVGWNQVEADWRIFLESGRVVALRDAAGGLAATAATLPLGPEVAWISMVIVRVDQRGRGLATHLLARCVDEVRATGRTPGLDATPAGRAVYLRLGFEDSLALTRWRRPGRARAAPGSPGILPRDQRLRPAEPSDRPAIARLDRTAFGADRHALLERLLVRSGGFATVAEAGGRLRGFVLGRDGRTATHLGPLVAEDEVLGAALAARALERIETPVTMDVADRFSAFTRWLGGCGFGVERPFTRMYAGRKEPFGDPSLAVAIAGPELG
jgi:ribosomal protein S18 acetylase RimI-like enzyme